MGKLVAVVPSYNRREELYACLKALLAQTRPLDEIVVVDNASADGTDKMMAGEFAYLTYVRLDANCGSAGGFHQGIKQAHAKGHDWIWLMDNDALPRPDALEILVSTSRSMEGRVFSSLIVTPDGKSINWGYHLYEGDTHREGTRVLHTVEEALSLGRPVLNGLAQFYTGAMIHREVVDRVGLPTPGFFTRGDEVDYVLRVQEAGYKTYTVVASQVVHPAEPRDCTRLFGHDSSIPRMVPLKQYYSLRNALINARRHNFGRDSLPVLYANAFVSYCRMSLVFPGERSRRLLYTVWAFIDALAGRVYINQFVR